jgi:hypothetical protein
VKIRKVRSALYTSAKALGDLQAVQRGAEKRSLAPVAKRVERRLVGRLLSRLIS